MERHTDLLGVYIIVLYGYVLVAVWPLVLMLHAQSVLKSHTPQVV